ncbi:MAG TPA: beta-galactosidase, partial [Armatimonadota bacterium]
MMTQEIQKVLPSWLCCSLLLVGVLLGQMARSAPAGGENLLTALPALTTATQWQVRPSDADMLTVTPAEQGYLHLRVAGTPGREGRLLLRTPLAIPDAMTDVTFRLIATSQGDAKLHLDLIIRDASGGEFLFYTTSPGAYEKGMFKPLEPTRKNRLLRFTVPGFTRQDSNNGRTATMRAPSASAKPQRPYTLLGLNVASVNGMVSDLYLSDASVTRLTPNRAAQYYQFNDQLYYGEMDPLPALSLGELCATPGSYRANWELFARYEGQPVMAGSKSWTISTAPGALPLVLQYAERLTVPLPEEGTYWLRVRVLRTDGGGAWATHEYRLYVMQGHPAVVRAPLATAQFPTDAYIQIAPQRASLIFAAPEPFRVPVALSPPPAETPAATAQVVVLTAGLRREVRRVNITPVWHGATPYLTTIDLSDLPAGVYLLRVALAYNGRLLDQVERLVGKQGAAPEQKLGAIPPSVRSSQDLLASDRPLFHLCPMVKKEQLGGEKTRWDYLQPFMAQAPSVSRDMEYMIPWSLVEPMPGVYDWEEVDHVLDYAQQQGLSVMLWPQMGGSEPEWLPSAFKENSAGSIFGHSNYLFHGARVNYFTAPIIRQAALRFWEQLVARYRTHPAVQGYYVLLEHPGEAPYLGWYDGYEPETQAAFRSACRAGSGTLQKLNARWGAHYTGWDAITPPEPAASPLYWLDWMQFRTGTVDSFVADCVRTIHRYDSKRLVMVYGDIPQNYAEKLQLPGCLMTNGGSHDAVGALQYSAVMQQGYQERTEDHSPGQWSGYFPYQLDASVFAMSLAGGGSMHCKAFMYTRVPGSKPEVPFTFADLRKAPYALDRYEKFMPIFTELRQTELLPNRMLVYRDLDSYFLDYHTTYMGYILDRQGMQDYFENQLPFSAAPEGLWKTAKLLLLTERTVTNL